jgi:hypothetical protein
MITASTCECALPTPKNRQAIRSKINPSISSGRSHPPAPPSPVVNLPKGWRICPLCDLHYVQKGKAHPRLCFLIQDA